MEKLAQSIIRFRWIIIISVIGLTIFLGYQIRNITINSDNLSTLPDDDPTGYLYKRIGSQYGGNDIGMIVLVGIVVNNAIVLIDYINVLRKRGIEKLEAIKQAGRIRLRPILITTFTTVLGLLPMAVGMGEGTEIRTPMAVTIIAGLLSATFLTLVLIPIVYNRFSK